MSERLRAQLCRYKCGTLIAWVGKTGEPRSTGFFEVVNGKVSDTEHTYARCDKVKLDTALAKEQEEKEKEHIEKVKADHGGGMDAFT